MSGRPADRRGSRISTGWNARLREIGMAMPMGRAALKLVMREMIARNRMPTAFSICR